MAKKKSAAPAAPAGKLQGKTVALVGKFGYHDMQRTKYERLIWQQEGSIVDPAKTPPDYLLVGEGRGGKPPGDVAKIQKKAPGVTALEIAAFAPLLIPDADALLALLAQGQDELPKTFWDDLGCLHRETKV